MSQAPLDAANTSKIPDFLIRDAVAGRLHPVVVQYLALNANLVALPERELVARLDPWCRVSQLLMAEPKGSTGLGDPMLVPTLAGFIGVERAEEFSRFARHLQRKIPDLETHLRLLAKFRSFAVAAAKDRAERRSEDQTLPLGRERNTGNPGRPLAAPAAIRPAASNNNQQLSSHSSGSVPLRGSMPLKPWPGHTYVVRRRSAGSE